jgi:Ras-related protein Rab-7A
VNVESTFNNLSNWKSEFLVKAFPPNSNDFPFVVVGNKIGKKKIPLKIDCEETRVVSHEKATKWCNSLGFPYFETSAKDGVKNILLKLKDQRCPSFSNFGKEIFGTGK